MLRSSQSAVFLVVVSFGLLTAIGSSKGANCRLMHDRSTVFIR